MVSSSRVRTLKVNQQVGKKRVKSKNTFHLGDAGSFQSSKDDEDFSGKNLEVKTLQIPIVSDTRKMDFLNWTCLLISLK
jgi:hypothetical protein